ncbi:MULTISPECIES: hypothetical protein [unclassified Curtobacterium]|uniref:hypothetical protein n=1 Tax=unclassified Curtobacterium TaxID=257496 RepID=UPI0039AF3E1A
MSGSLTRPSIARGTAVVLAVGACCAALLAIDNLLGFTGHHVFGAIVVPVLAATSVAAGSMAAAGGAFTRDAVRTLVAAGVVGFVATQSPATSSQLWFPIALVLQALVPLAFVAAGLRSVRQPVEPRAVRVLGVLLLVPATAWIVTAFASVALVVFLIAQACTLLVAAAEELHPVLRRAWGLARGLWSSAAVR